MSDDGPDILTRERARRTKENRRVKAYYRAVRDAGGRRITVQLDAVQLRAVLSMAGIGESAASVLRRLAMDEARRRGDGEA